MQNRIVHDNTIEKTDCLVDGRRGYPSVSPSDTTIVDHVVMDSRNRSDDLVLVRLHLLVELAVLRCVQIKKPENSINKRILPTHHEALYSMILNHVLCHTPPCPCNQSKKSALEPNALDFPLSNSYIVYMHWQNLTLTAIESNIAKSAEMRHKTNICASINAFIFYI